jgi:hypothetical protein
MAFAVALLPAETDDSGQCGACGTSSLRTGAGSDQACQYVARIDPNVISRDGWWCSLSLLEDLAFIVANEGTFLMKTDKLSRYVIIRTGGSVRSARRAPWARMVRAQATRGILVPALMLVSLSAGAAASPGHGIGDYVHASAHQPAHSLALRVNADSIKSCKIDNRIRWYAAIEQMPWMYAAINKMPWMYAPTRMYAPQARHASRARICLMAVPLGGGAHSQRS